MHSRVGSVTGWKANMIPDVRTMSAGGSTGGLRLALKAMFVGFLTLLLFIPLGMIQGSIQERQMYRQQAVQSVAESFAGPQILSGPVLVLNYVDEVPVEDKDALGKPIQRIAREARRFIAFPRTYSIDGKLLPSVRKRGLHQVRVYELQSVQGASFDAALPPLPSKGQRIWSRPYLSFGIDDVRGLAGTPALAVDGKPLALQQGLGGHREGGGLHAELPAIGEASQLKFTLRMQSALGGTESLSVVPLADSNRIRLASSWPHPQFAGRFLPRSHREGASGFSGEWDLSSLAAGSQQQYRGQERSLDALSVSLIDPVNIYSQADRASKYGILFVLLTFVAFFMVELLKRLRIHAVQYTLVGLALAIFFLLLLGLSEHMEFWIAYLVSSLACIGLLGTYTAAVLRSAKRGFSFGCGLSLLYSALYGLLVSEDNALVLGALMLFAILATLMLVTRRIDWYAPALEGQEQGGQ